jgi:hypothetical protein
MTSVTFSSWWEFRERLIGYFQQNASRRSQLIFRGQGDANWSLETTLDRWRKFENDLDREDCVRALLDQFSRELGHLEVSPLEEIRGEALELLARHHGLPSPLMDWTQSPYVAAYFAFESAQFKTSGEVAIWVLDRSRIPTAFNLMDLIEDYRLVQFNRRARRQQGVFIRVRTGRLPLETLAADTMTRYLIPVGEARSALTELDEMGINSTNLFADMDGAARTAKFRVHERE